MQIDPKIRALIDKSVHYHKNHNFYWTEKNGEYKIIANYATIYDLVIWAIHIWEMDPNKTITGLDEDSNIGYFTIGGKNGKTSSQFRIRT